ncbi:MAG TPA: hypothetical protein VJ845_02705 [Haploplasma sp.]|nr:hypothetical protein [Haploplasma sp.]
MVQYYLGDKMKVFMKILSVIALLFLGVMVFNSGKAARDAKYIEKVILADKGSNEIHDNMKESFVGDAFALNSLIYKQNKVGNIEMMARVTDNGKDKSVYLNIDIYQVMGFFISEEIPAQFQAIVNEFSVNAQAQNLKLTGNYKEALHGENHKDYYTVENRNFPLFGINNTITNGKLNPLESIVFSFQGEKEDIQILELVVDESKTELSEKRYLKTMSGYPENEKQMQEDITDVLTTKSGGFKIPTEEQVEALNELGYNYKLFEGQDKYNYLIYIYVGIYVVVAGVALYFLFVNERIKNKKNKGNQ